MATSDEKFPLHVTKKWGFEIWFANDESRDYCGKELYIKAGHRFSYHYHEVKDEVFYLVSGFVLVEFGEGDELPDRMDCDHRRILLPGQRFHVPTGLRHRVSSYSEDSRLIEVSTFHRDEDSFRIPGLLGGRHFEPDPRRSRQMST